MRKKTTPRPTASILSLLTGSSLLSSVRSLQIAPVRVVYLLLVTAFETFLVLLSSNFVPKFLPDTLDSDFGSLLKYVDEKSEKRKAMIRLKTDEYMRRAEEIKASLNKPAEDSYVASLFAAYCSAQHCFLM